MPQPQRTAVTVRTPATSANLGPGFDALGIALDLSDEIEVRLRDDRDVTVAVEGEGAGTLPLDDSHLVVRAMRAAFDAVGQTMPGVDLRCRNAIPHGRGLGSSASAIVAGVAAAAALADGGDRLDREWIFQTAADIEGHPDNVAPCVYGGFTIAWRGAKTWRAWTTSPAPGVRPIVCVPRQSLSTERARGLLPETVPHADAAFSAGRAALLVAAVRDCPDLLFEATEDRLHQSYRAEAMPDSAALVESLRGDGLAAVVSGAGPTVLVLHHDSADAPGGPADRPLDGFPQNNSAVVDSIRQRAGTEWHIRPLAIDLVGVRVTSPRSWTCVEE
ncbi:homoserine kinase [Thermobifida cellulosilytica]|uniref:Homoserine kinase n=1 Tax=Thermobifida cellulosilytica TB100 TaxID=665004 RepID=A0A147KFT1_THECS|nr:homoserine kinase [Thermobifida cellulosilytica]KUP96171.1 serine kinase [Thermobifida cellulosilytica TB100]